MPEGWRGGRFERLLEDIMTPPQHRAELPGPAPKVFTQADVDEAIRKHREDKARQSRDDA
jgi:hypothetical protein